jgi:hypothetical protein
LDGRESVDCSVRLFRRTQGRPEGMLSWFGAELEEAGFREMLTEEGRIIYEFDVNNAYGLI